jgi:hypothetical protein
VRACRRLPPCKAQAFVGSADAHAALVGPGSIDLLALETESMFAAVSSMRRAFAAAVLLCMTAAGAQAQPADPLPSWNAGVAKARIVAFVQAVTEPGGKDFVPPADRIAVFDNDGTLWSEQPMYFQLAFALDRVRAPAVVCSTRWQ